MLPTLLKKLINHESPQNGKTAQQIAEEKELAAAASADSAVHAPRRGVFQRISDWWQKNTREIRLVSSIIL